MPDPTHRRPTATAITLAAADGERAQRQDARRPVRAALHVRTEQEVRVMHDRRIHEVCRAGSARKQGSQHGRGGHLQQLDLPVRSTTGHRH